MVTVKLTGWLAGMIPFASYTRAHNAAAAVTAPVTTVPCVAASFAFAVLQEVPVHAPMLNPIAIVASGETVVNEALTVPALAAVNG